MSWCEARSPFVNALRLQKNGLPVWPLAVCSASAPARPSIPVTIASFNEIMDPPCAGQSGEASSCSKFKSARGQGGRIASAEEVQGDGVVHRGSRETHGAAAVGAAVL